MDPNKVISTISREFRGSPVIFALVILNLGLFAMVSYLIVKSADARFRERKDILLMLETCVKDNRR